MAPAVHSCCLIWCMVVRSRDFSAPVSSRKQILVRFDLTNQMSTANIQTKGVVRKFGLGETFSNKVHSSGGFRGGRAGSAPPALLGDGLTPSFTVMLANAKF